VCKRSALMLRKVFGIDVFKPVTARTAPKASPASRTKSKTKAKRKK
jgi:hypothetical protein